MANPYRSAAVEVLADVAGERPSWLRLLVSRLLVATRVWQRYTAADTNDILDRARAPSFEDLREALRGLQRARDQWTLVGADCTGLYVLDRCTGRRFSPRPEEIADLLENRCPVCRMWGDEPCDVGLHG